jgi:hypothetical protein
VHGTPEGGDGLGGPRPRTGEQRRDTLVRNAGVLRIRGLSDRQKGGMDVLPLYPTQFSPSRVLIEYHFLSVFLLLLIFLHATNSTRMPKCPAITLPALPFPERTLILLRLLCDFFNSSNLQTTTIILTTTN